MKDADMQNSPLIKSWRGRIMIYCGNENIGKRMITDALQSDPDLRDAQRAIKGLKV